MRQTYSFVFVSVLNRDAFPARKYFLTKYQEMSNVYNSIAQRRQYMRATILPYAIMLSKACWPRSVLYDIGEYLGLSTPKQHSIWAPVGPQLGPNWAQLGPIWECCLGCL